MSDEGDLGPEFATPAEESLHGQLEVVREDPPVPAADLISEVAATLRWQALVVIPITAVLSIAGGIVNGLRTLIRPGTS